MANPSQSELSILDNSHNVFQNVEAQPQIASYLSDMGYDESKMAEGKPLLDAASALSDANRVETNEARAASALLEEELRKLKKKYALIRRKAKVVFRHDPVLMARLMLTGNVPKAYVNFLNTVRVFVQEIKRDAGLQEMIAELKVTVANIDELQKGISDVEMARANYLKEDGESQNATQQKDKAFAALEKWMSKFYEVARIAMEDEPQLLEALGLTIKR